MGLLFFISWFGKVPNMATIKQRDLDEVGEEATQTVSFQKNYVEALPEFKEDRAARAKCACTRGAGDIRKLSGVQIT